MICSNSASSPSRNYKCRLQKHVMKSKLLRIYFIWDLAECLIESYFTKISQPISKLKETHFHFKSHNISFTIPQITCESAEDLVFIISQYWFLPYHYISVLQPDQHSLWADQLSYSDEWPPGDISPWPAYWAVNFSSRPFLHIPRCLAPGTSRLCSSLDFV